MFIRPMFRLAHAYRKVKQKRQKVWNITNNNINKPNRLIKSSVSMIFTGVYLYSYLVAGHYIGTKLPLTVW